MLSTSDTIVAVATPPGHGGIGVVRLSGPSAAEICRALINRAEPLEPRHATFARVVGTTADDRVRTVDQVVVTWFAAPRSFTGEDVVEISGHGSPWLLHEIVELARRQGARLAEPGEFTFRAYLNGRLDLVQAEAVADLVNAVTPRQARVAMDQLEGTLTADVAAIDAALFDLAARLEASLDFPDEGFHFITRDEARSSVTAVRHQLGRLVEHGRVGRVVREGRLVVIAGRPNVGKSSLFNALAAAERAIVAEIAGTTRDVLTERIDILGVPITLVDTAGVRQGTDAVEKEGVRRARQAQQVAALTLVVLDGATPLTHDDEQALVELTGPRIVVVSKRDLPRAWEVDRVSLSDSSTVEVSAVTGAGLDVLRHAIVAALTGTLEWRDEPQVSNQRHLAQVEAALDALAHAQDALSAGATEELVLADLGEARQALEWVTGRRAPEDLLQHIFSTFCVGK